MKQTRIYQAFFFILLAAFVLYGVRFIQRTAITVDGEQMYALFDDAMISMQYAKNLAHGHGLVWNVGQTPIEGYSNPLWVLLMGVIHVLPISLLETSLYVKAMSLIFLAINLVVVKKLSEHISANPVVPLLAVFLTAFYFPLNNWSLQGMEVGFEALLLNGGLLLALHNLQRKRFTLWPYALFALAVLLRMDAAAPTMAICGAMAWIDQKNRQAHLKFGLTAILGTLLALTLFRLVYFGDWLPNTYYLKLNGISAILRISLGLRRFWDFIWNSNWVLFALPLALPLLDKRKILLPFYGLFLAQVAYSVYVGGDAWEHDGGANRFIAAVMPIFFILLAHTLGSFQQLVLQSTKLKAKWVKTATEISLGSFAMASLFSLNNLEVQNPVAKWTLRDKPVFTESVERYASMGMALGRVTTPNAVIAVVTAGNIPYFSERTAIDMLGKNDPFIAKGPMRINSSLFEPGNYRPGHNKWNYAYSIGQFQPDVIAQIWEGTDEEAKPYLINYQIYVIDGIPYYFLKDSPNILWELIPPQEN